ncbi:hypothetical protein ALC62_08687 [Cyphomyrmex costatus]|uniref:Uncharacterized protein n=1 Tax=Cyphomyrmex costatus TaxID=456900 RepID=A0A151IGK1_9HYME|nr:hypothetical protein ALC62_08687 [Cyphomyrmex costatus]
MQKHLSSEENKQTRKKIAFYETKTKKFIFEDWNSHCDKFLPPQIAIFVKIKHNFINNLKKVKSIVLQCNYIRSSLFAIEIYSDFSLTGLGRFDIVSTSINTKCSHFVSRHPDLFAVAIDAFSLNWSIYIYISFYALPPFILILGVMREIITDGVEGVVVVPWWPAQP